jgi:hypothetical protein
MMAKGVFIMKLLTILAVLLASATPASASYTFQYVCGEIRVEATWRREKDNAGTDAVRFMEPLSCIDSCRTSSSCRGSALCRNFFGNIGKNIRNFKMRAVDEPPTLNGKRCRAASDEEMKQWEN